jgi:hypothetical protein
MSLSKKLSNHQIEVDLVYL